MPFVYQILGYPRQNASSWIFLLFLSPRRRKSEINVSPRDELRDRDGVEEYIHVCKAARSHPGEVLSAKLSPWLSTFWAGFRPWDEHLPSVFSRSSPTVRLWDFEAIGIFNCTKKSQRIAPYAWRYKSSRKFCSARIDLESLNIRIGGSWPASE